MSRQHPINRALSWLGRNEFVLILGLVSVAGIIWGFAELADEVVEGETRRIDRWLLLLMRNPADLSDPIGPGWLEELGRDFTALGGVAVLTFTTLAAAGYMVLLGKGRAAAFTVLVIAGGMLLSTLLKFGFDRPRPDLVSHGSIVYTASFPSGHSMMAAVTYLTLAALLARIMPRRRLKAYILIIAVVLTVLVGISRVYMGVHWPTDVLAGWAAGGAWSLLCWLGVRYLQRRGQLEDEAETPELD